MYSATQEESMKRSVLGSLPMLPLVVGLALSAEPEHKYDGVYAGKRTLTKGIASGECPAVDDVSVTIKGETLAFTNKALKNYIMPFNPKDEGSFGQVHTDERGYVVSYHGRIVGSLMEADVQSYAQSPPCEYHWHLEKQQFP
jgi:hypothetical protein